MNSRHPGTDHRLALHIHVHGGPDVGTFRVRVDLLNPQTLGDISRAFVLQGSHLRHFPDLVTENCGRIRAGTCVITDSEDRVASPHAPFPDKCDPQGFDLWINAMPPGYRNFADVVAAENSHRQLFAIRETTVHPVAVDMIAQSLRAVLSDCAPAGTCADSRKKSPACSLCLSNLPNMAAVPCGHALFCGDCVKGFCEDCVKESRTPQCPICRREVDSWLTLYT